MSIERESFLERKKASDRMIELSHESQRIRTIADGRPLNYIELKRLSEIGAELKTLEDLL